MRTADLSGSLLDYWTARAEGVPAGELEIRSVQRPDPRTPDTICVRRISAHALMRIDYSTNPALWAPLIKKHTIAVIKGINQITFPGWCARVGLAAAYDDDTDNMFAADPEAAICRAVVRAAFGDEVEDLPC